MAKREQSEVGFDRAQLKRDANFKGSFAQKMGKTEWICPGCGAHLTDKGGQLICLKGCHRTMVKKVVVPKQLKKAAPWMAEATPTVLVVPPPSRVERSSVKPVVLPTRTAHPVILHGDCVDQMDAMPEASVDAIVCDPPYGLEFMGKEWDKLSGSFTETGGKGQWAKAHGVARKGFDGYGALPNYVGGGNVKCPDCGRPVNGRDPNRPDPRAGYRCACGGAKRVRNVAAAHAMQLWHLAWATAALRVLKPGGYLLAFGGSRTVHRLACALEDAGFEIRDEIMWLYGTGFPKSLNLRSDHAGWGTALKPAHEPIIVARKPLDGTVAANVAKHSTGALNIDGCRIGFVHGDTTSSAASAGLGRGYKATKNNGILNAGKGGVVASPHQLGRWPANVVLDEEAAAMLDEQAGARKSGAHRADEVRTTSKTKNVYGQRAADPIGGRPSDSGGASRFFYCSKASKSERGKDCTHPTVKPINLMRWLVRLVTPPGGTVLDPFTGSGTTGIACKLEGFRFIGCEKEGSYFEIAKRRIAKMGGKP